MEYHKQLIFQEMSPHTCKPGRASPISCWHICLWKSVKMSKISAAQIIKYRLKEKKTYANIFKTKIRTWRVAEIQSRTSHLRKYWHFLQSKQDLEEVQRRVNVQLVILPSFSLPCFLLCPSESHVKASGWSADYSLQQWLITSLQHISPGHFSVFLQFISGRPQLRLSKEQIERLCFCFFYPPWDSPVPTCSASHEDPGSLNYLLISTVFKPCWETSVSLFNSLTL